MSENVSTTKEESPTPDGVERAAASTVFRPRVDIVEGPDAVLLFADVPGADEGHTDVSLEKNVLTIRASVQPGELEGFTLAAAEYEVGDFERAFTLSDEIDRNGIEAVVSDGVLRVTLPKAKDSSSRKITVQAG